MFVSEKQTIAEDDTAKRDRQEKQRIKEEEEKEEIAERDRQEELLRLAANEEAKVSNLVSHLISLLPLPSFPFISISYSTVKRLSI